MEMCDELRKKPKRSFSKAWLSNDQFKSWIRKVSFDDSFYRCIIYVIKIFRVTHMF